MRFGDVIGITKLSILLKIYTDNMLADNNYVFKWHRDVIAIICSYYAYLIKLAWERLRKRSLINGKNIKSDLRASGGNKYPLKHSDN